MDRVVWTLDFVFFLGSIYINKAAGWLNEIEKSVFIVIQMAIQSFKLPTHVSRNNSVDNMKNNTETPLSIGHDN